MLNRRALFGLPLAALPAPALAATHEAREPQIDEDRCRRLNPAVAAGLSERFIQLAQSRLDEMRGGGSYLDWHGVVSAAFIAEGHARQLFEIARIRARDTLKSEPQS
jgi:hypothetical protein